MHSRAREGLDTYRQGGRLTMHDVSEHIRRLFTITGLADCLADDPGN